MKHLKYLLLICLAAAAACSKDKTLSLIHI